MDDLPSQVDRRVRQELKKLNKPWQVVKKKDHYFVKIGENSLVCIGDNSSKPGGRRTMKTLHRIRKA